MIILSCGHKVSDFEHAHNIMIKTTDRMGEKAISHMVVCGPCEDRYRQNGLIFDSEDVAYEWVVTENW